MAIARLPRHIGIIPDGNRRWAKEHKLPTASGYSYGLLPGLKVYQECLKLGVKEITFYGFTQDNVKRPADQVDAFQHACVKAVSKLSKMDAQLLVVGNSTSPLFPPQLLPYTKRTVFGSGSIKVNFLVNYSWEWDLNHSRQFSKNPFSKYIASSDVSRIDLIIRWGGHSRLSGFLPVQSVYADMYIVDALWPDYEDSQLHDALKWYQDQDVTLGG